MIKTRLHHWNCSKFADFIRGTKKPYALGWKEWEDWRKDAQKDRPFRYYLSETVLKQIQDIIYFPLDVYNTVRIYLYNRFIDKTHYLKTGLEPGQYYEFDHRILHGLFNELVDYIEVELAHLSKWDSNKKYTFKKGRCVEAGLDHLNWAKSLVNDEFIGYNKGEKEYGKPAHQAKVAKKILELYNWWKNIRPNRPNPHDVAGFTDKDCDDILSTRSNKKLEKSLKIIQDIEEQYDKEDTKMMVDLIKIRKTIWC